MEHLISVLPLVLDRINRAKRVLLLTDFDGTLAPIVERPEMAVMPEDTRRLLEDLSRQQRFTLGVISGRALSDLKTLVDVPGIIYAGNHGFEIEGPGWSFTTPFSDEVKSLFKAVRHILNLTLGSIKGVLIEDKGLTLSVHYRQVDEDRVRDIRTQVEHAVNSPFFKQQLKITPGKKVYEIRPAVTWDKGKAIRLLIEKFSQNKHKNRLVPIYMGDDLTDEDGFEEIAGYGNGVTVHVGGIRHNSAARYYLKSTDEVSVFLMEILHYTRGEIRRGQLSKA